MEFLHDRMSVSSSDTEEDKSDYKYAHLMDKKQYKM